jgi:uncharacterized membrane protein YesL
MKFGFPASLRIIGRAIVDWWDGWLDMVMVTSIWFLAQLTIVLGPPATFGVYYVAYNMINGEALGVRGLIEGARKYFWKALLWGLANLAVFATLFVNVQFYGSIETSWGIYLLIIMWMLTALWITTNFYALPFFLEQTDQRLRVAWKNGLLTSLATPLYTLVLLVFVLLVFGLSLGLVIPIFLGLPGIIPMLGFRAVSDRLIAFGLRKPERTPKEIEFEESSKVRVPELSDHPSESGAPARKD